MKQFFLTTSLFLLSLVIAVPAVQAIDLGAGLTKKAAVRAGFDKNTDETTFSETLGTAVRATLSFLAVFFMILMVYAGYLWMNARGDEGKVDKAQSIIRAAVIGMVLTVGAYSITNFVVPAIVERAAGPEETATPTGT